jgi:hypothetical protein
MRIVLHTPRVFVEEVDVPNASGDMPDVELLAEATGIRARRLSASTCDTGSTFIFARGEDDLASAGRRAIEARDAAAAALEVAKATAIAAMDAGSASEREVAAKLGVDRNTVRAWRGKPRSA